MSFRICEKEELEEKVVLEIAQESFEAVKQAEIVFPESMKIHKPNTGYLATYNEGSNPREGYQHTCTGTTELLTKEDAAETNTGALAYSLWTKNNVSEPGRDHTVDATTNGDDIVNRMSRHTESENTVAEVTAHHKGTANVQMTNITRNESDNEKETLKHNEPMTKDAGDDGKEYEILKHNLQEKIVKHSILLKKNQEERIPEGWKSKDSEHDQQAEHGNHPNGRDSTTIVETKEGINANLDELREFRVPELEIRLGIDDLKIYYDTSVNEVYQFDKLTKLIFEIVMLPKGKGIHFISQPSQEMHSGDDDRHMPGDNLKDDNDDGNNKEIPGTITLITENKNSDLVGAYLNGVKRNILVDMEAAVSIIHNSDYPERSRIFKILTVQKYCLPQRHNMNWRRVYPNVAPIVEK